MVEEKGMINIFTLANNIVVNNILASCRISLFFPHVYGAFLIVQIYCEPQVASGRRFIN
jgi:hypothetical protein